MQQIGLFGYVPLPTEVNVASVPQRSLFRYPGGKTWLVPHLRRWLSPQVREHAGVFPVRPTRLIEPFAGGGIISLTAVAENLVDRATMVELDKDVAAVWQTILHEEDWNWLVHEIVTFNLTYDNVMSLLAKTDVGLKEEAFRTILRNRVNRGGILAPGAGIVKEGENGRGITSRWYPMTLKKRIQDIVHIRDRITFIYGDGMNILSEQANRTDTIFFIDPPYTVAGKKAGERLYKHFKLDHERLFEIASKLRSDFLMTYDNVDDVKQLAHNYGFDTQVVAMKNTHHARMTELLIGPNLEWLRLDSF